MTVAKILKQQRTSFSTVSVSTLLDIKEQILYQDKVQLIFLSCYKDLISDEYNIYVSFNRFLFFYYVYCKYVYV